jgi:hypothetical protein
MSITDLDDYRYYIGMLLSDKSISKERFLSYFGESEIKILKAKGYFKEGD